MTTLLTYSQYLASLFCCCCSFSYPLTLLLLLSLTLLWLLSLLACKWV